MKQKFVSMEQAALLLQGVLSALDSPERTFLQKSGFSRKEQREMRHQTYRLIGFLRLARGIKVDPAKLDRRFDARRAHGARKY